VIKSQTVTCQQTEATTKTTKPDISVILTSSNVYSYRCNHSTGISATFYKCVVNFKILLLTRLHGFVLGKWCNDRTDGHKLHLRQNTTVALLACLTF